MGDILADAKRMRAEALETLAAVEGGARLAPGLTRVQAIADILQSIATYDEAIRRYGWRDNA